MSQTQPEMKSFIDDVFGDSDDDSVEEQVATVPFAAAGDDDGLFESDEEDAPAAAPLAKKSKLIGGDGARSRLKKMSAKPSGAPVSVKGAADASDEYDSGEEVVRTAEDDAFIDSDDDDDIMAEYRGDKQDFNDERPEDQKKMKKRRRDDEDSREAPEKDNNPLSVALGEMKKKKHEAWTDDKKGELAQEVLLLIDRAAEEDEELFREGNVPIMKLKALPKVQHLVSIKVLQPTLLEYNLLTALNRWIEPKDKNTLPGLSVRAAVYEMLKQLPCQLHHLKRQPALIGKTVMKLLKSPLETAANKQILNDVVEKWNRLIFNKSADPRSKTHRRALHVGDMPAPAESRRQSSVESAGTDSSRGFEEILSQKVESSADGYGRVRVPFSNGFQFSVQPVSKVDKKAARELLRETSGGSKDVLMKKMKDMSGSGKKQQFRAITASLTGKDKH